mgnify:CR=1 FL=1
MTLKEALKLSNEDIEKLKDDLKIKIIIVLWTLL